MLPDLGDVAEQLVAQARADGVNLTGPGGVLTGLVRRVLETGLEAELTEHLGHEHRGRSAGGNVRNGTSSKTVTTEIGEVEIAVPRDRDGTFDPQTVPKHRRRLEGFNASVVSLDAKGMTVRGQLTVKMTLSTCETSDRPHASFATWTTRDHAPSSQETAKLNRVEHTTTRRKQP